jgi:hypothetical protein
LRRNQKQTKANKEKYKAHKLKTTLEQQAIFSYQEKVVEEQPILVQQEVIVEQEAPMANQLLPRCMTLEDLTAPLVDGCGSCINPPNIAANSFEIKLVSPHW